MKSLDKKLDSALGALIGAAVGDALGAPLEFLTPRPQGDWVTEMKGGGVLHWKPGEVTDDTIMSRAICEMYIEKGGYHQRTVVDKWLEWKKSQPKDIGNWTTAALSEWSRFLLRKDVAAAHEKDNLNTIYDAQNIDVFGTEHPVVGLWLRTGQKDAGNGGVMRCMPTALFEPILEERVMQTTRLCMDTHPDPKCVQSCVFVVEVLHELIDREFENKEDAMKMILEAAGQLIQDEEFKEAMEVDFTEKDITNGGYTVDTVVSAVAGFNVAEDFKTGLCRVVNVGNDADSVGAVCGAIMGAYYGYSAIPQEYLDTLEVTDQLLDFGEKLFSRKTKVWNKQVSDWKKMQDAIDTKSKDVESE